MRIVICDTAETATAKVADRIVDQVGTRPDSVLGLATGGTMERLYARLLQAHRTGLSFAGIKAFNLDEYVGLAADHPQSYAYYMRHHLFDHIDIDQQNCFIPSGTAHPFKAAEAYEALIAHHGPINLQLLGLGKNGHIGFNEPGCSLSSATREKALSRDTLAANSRYFDDPADMPVSAITMGIKTIRNADQIVLLALGAGKARAVKAMIEGPVSAYCPASVLQMHPDVMVVIDTDAAQLLEFKDHYMLDERIQQQRENRLDEAL